MASLAPVVGALRPADLPKQKPLGWLQHLLYWHFFTGWRPPEGPPDRAFEVELGAAFTNASWWDTGWRYVGEYGHHRMVHREVRLFVKRSELPARKLRKGAEVELRLPCLSGAQPGFCHVTSPHGGPERDAHYKLYVNLAPAGAEPLLQTLASLEARYAAKVFEQPGEYRRRDTGLVYAARGSGLLVARAVLELERKLGEAAFRAPPPPLTLHLSRSVGIAESTSDESSYGQQRCETLARGVLAALRDELPFGDAWLKPLRAAFAKDGLDLDQPWRKTLPFEPFEKLAMEAPVPGKR